MDGEYPQTVHTSATGLGSDSTTAATFFSYVESPDVVFKEAEVKIQLNGLEGDLLLKEQMTYIDIEPWMQDKENYGSILNGFEIRSLGKADQLKICYFAVDEPFYNDETGQVILTSYFNLATNCRTIECNIFKNKTSYELTLHVLLFAYDSTTLDYDKTSATRSYEWDTKIEVKEEPRYVTLTGQNDDYPTSAIGITGMAIVMDTEHWLLESDLNVFPIEYSQKTGDMTAQVNMKYVEWTKGMDEFTTAKFKSSFAKRRSGYALLDVNLKMIQFRNAEVLHAKSDTKLFWKGWNQDASSDEAQSVVDVSSILKFQ